MAMIQGFQKLFSWGDLPTHGMLKDAVVEVTEKIDGSQFNFGKLDGVVYMRSKNANVFHGDSNKMFNAAKEYVKSIEDRLPESALFHGEYLQSPKHNTLEYARVPKGHFMLFGITYLTERPVYTTPESHAADRAEWAERLGCEPVPVLYQGPAPDVVEGREWLHSFMGKESALGKATMEGVVVKNYSRPCHFNGKDYLGTFAKMVSAEFKEKHVDGWKQSNPSALEQIGAAYNSQARWRKAIQRAREDGTLTGTVRDIGPLMKSIVTDISEEEETNIKNMLYRLFHKDLMRMATKNFPETYKHWLENGEITP